VKRTHPTDGDGESSTSLPKAKRIRIDPKEPPVKLNSQGTADQQGKTTNLLSTAWVYVSKLFSYHQSVYTVYHVCDCNSHDRECMLLKSNTKC